MAEVNKDGRTIIRRNRTFLYRGELWHVGGSPHGVNKGWGYELWRDSDGKTPEGADDFDSLNQVRDWVDESRRNNWDLLTGEPLDADGTDEEGKNA